MTVFVKIYSLAQLKDLNEKHLCMINGGQTMRIEAGRGFDRPAQTRSYHVMMMMIILMMMMMMRLSNVLLPGQALTERRRHMRGKLLGEPSPWIFRLSFLHHFGYNKVIFKERKSCFAQI